MLLEYTIGTATVAVSFSGYLEAFLLSTFGFHVDKRLTTPPLIWDSKTDAFVVTGGFFDLPAVVLLIGITSILVLGIRESAIFNAVSVGVKLTVILIFVFTGAAYINTSNWSPFIPPSEGGDRYGPWGVIRAASVVFFAYIGFDSVCTVAQESIDPAFSLPVSILLSLFLSTLLYIIVALILTGLVPYTELAGDHPIAVGIRVTGMVWLESLVDFGAMCGLASTCLGGLMGIGRVCSTIAADGLLPAFLSKLHPRFKTPWIPTIIAGALASLMAAVLPISVLASLTSAGTLLAFFFVCLAVPVMRHLEPDKERLFKVPGGPVIPILGSLSALGLLVFAGWGTMLRLLGWLIIGWIFYFFYGFKRPEESKEDLELAVRAGSGPINGEQHTPKRSRPRRKRTTDGGEPLLYPDSGDETDSSSSSTAARSRVALSGMQTRMISRPGSVTRSEAGDDGT